MNKNTSTRGLEGAVEYLLLDPENCTFERSFNAEGKLDAWVMTHEDRELDLVAFLRKANFKHINLNQELTLAYNVFLEAPERYFPPRLTDYDIKMEKDYLGEDLEGLLPSELKIINSYTGCKINSYMNLMLATSFTRFLSEANNNNWLVEVFLGAMFLLSALNKPLASGKAKTYEVYRGKSSQRFHCQITSDINFIKESGLLSTSLKESVARTFLSDDDRRAKTQHRILKYSAFRGKCIVPVSAYESEAEILTSSDRFLYEADDACEYLIGQQVAGVNPTEEDDDSVDADDTLNFQIKG